jgi:hypothetical protein
MFMFMFMFMFISKSTEFSPTDRYFFNNKIKRHNQNKILETKIKIYKTSKSKIETHPIVNLYKCKSELRL